MGYLSLNQVGIDENKNGHSKPRLLNENGHKGRGFDNAKQDGSFANLWKTVPICD